MQDIITILIKVHLPFPPLTVRHMPEGYSSTTKLHMMKPSVARMAKMSV